MPRKPRSNGSSLAKGGHWREVKLILTLSLDTLKRVSILTSEDGFNRTRLGKWADNI